MSGGSAQIDVGKRLENNFDQERGRSYKPWLMVDRFSSLGHQGSMAGHETGREHLAHIGSKVLRIIESQVWQDHVQNSTPAP
jgi:hypothetical protein